MEKQTKSSLHPSVEVGPGHQKFDISVLVREKKNGRSRSGGGPFSSGCGKENVARENM